MVAIWCAVSVTALRAMALVSAANVMAWVTVLIAVRRAMDAMARHFVATAMG